MPSPSPSMSAPSPLTQHSPMPSPMTPSPGPVPASIPQTSPRTLSQGMHHLDDRPFSPNSDGTMRQHQSPGGVIIGQNRMPHGPVGQMRIGSHQLMNQNTGLGVSMNSGGNPGLLMGRGMSVSNMNMHQQQRSLAFLDSQGSMRMRSMGPSDQLK